MMRSLPFATVAVLALTGAGFTWASLDAMARTEAMLPQVQRTIDRACVQLADDAPPFCATVIARTGQ